MARRPPQASKPPTSKGLVAEGLDDVTRRVCTLLEAEGAKFALIGGLAVSARATPRFTGDVDFAVWVADDRKAERLVVAMQNAGFMPITVMEDRRDRRLATVRFKSGLHVADLLFRFTGIESDIVRGATLRPIIGGFSTRVASVGHLLAMKIQAGRTKDLLDVESLLSVATAGDRLVAVAAVRKMVRLGNDEGRDLMSELERAFQKQVHRPKTLVRRRAPRKGGAH